MLIYDFVLHLYCRFKGSACSVSNIGKDKFSASF